MTAQFFQILRKELIKIILITLLFGGVAFGFAATQPPVYQAATTVSVNPKTLLKQSAVNFYLYDNYYAIQASGFVTDSVAAWVQSPGIVAQIYDRAGLVLPQGDSQKLSRIFSTKKETEKVNVLTITIQGEDKNQVQKLIDSASKVLKDELEKLNQSQTTSAFEGNFTPAVVVVLPSKKLVYAGLAGFIGLLVAIVWSLQKNTTHKRGGSHSARLPRRDR